MSLEKKTSAKKTTTLGINRIPENTTILSIAQVLSEFSSNITEIRIVSSKMGHRNALISFDSVEACEKAREGNAVKLENETCSLFFAHNNSTPNVNLSASENKIYVKYPTESSFDEILQLFPNITIKRPDHAKNYFFATCSGMEEQCQLVQTLNNKKVEGGILSVKVAIDRIRRKTVPHAVF